MACDWLAAIVGGPRKFWLWMLGVALVAVALPETGFAATSDRVRVIDGDTIDISGQRIRLHGIDTPEAKQTCQREGFIWLCGAVATKVLRKLIGDTQVTCTQRDMDRYGRIVAVCYVNGLNLNAAMVQSGMALAYRKYSNDYIGQEASAKAAQRGLWAGKFVAPWEWRRGKRLASETALNDNPTGCRIKGNVGSKGDRIYHMPGGRWYDRTVITASKGERWFCSEGEAKAAGWQRAGTPAFAMPRSNTGQSPTVTEPIKACCKICRKGQACGNSCISRRYICRRPPGCACNG